MCGMSLCIFIILVDMNVLIKALDLGISQIEKGENYSIECNKKETFYQRHKDSRSLVFSL